MADILLDVQSAPSTPSAGQAVLYVDSTTKQLRLKDDAGFRRGLHCNFSTASQAPAAATRTYITGSSLPIPNGGLQVGTCFEWVFSVTKTAAGTAASTYDVCVGTNGTTDDTARVSFTKPAGTAAADQGTVRIRCICRGPIGASGVFVGQFTMTHNLSATGHATIPCVDVNTVSAAFDVSVANLIVGVCVTSGASDALTFQLVQAMAWNL